MHLSFWCVYLSFFIYQVSAFQRSPEINWLRVFTVVTIQVSFAMAIGYLNYFIFLPRFLRNRKAWRYILELGVAFAILITARIYLERYLIDGFTHQERYLYAQRFFVSRYHDEYFYCRFPFDDPVRGRLVRI